MILSLLGQMSPPQGTKWWLPRDISTHGATIDGLIAFMHWFMAILFVGWGIFFIYCLIRYRQRPGHNACYDLIKAKPSKVVEVVVIIIEAVLLIGFSMPAWAAYRNEPPAEKDRFEVRVVAQQFAWNIHYPGKDGKFGRRDPRKVNAQTNPIGLDSSDPDAKDDYVSINNMYVPRGKPIYVRLSSLDVIHSFAIPVLRVKQDVLPGMQIPVWFTATETSRTGPDGKPVPYDIQCAQLCGNNHWKMKGSIFIMEPAEFEAWYATAAVEEEVVEE